jgi:hypothetical protein
MFNKGVQDKTESLKLDGSIANKFYDNVVFNKAK